MNKDSQTFKTFRNITYNVAGFFWPIVFTLVITPIIIFKLGIKDYGIYIFITTAFYFIGLIDLGIGTAVSKLMSFYYGKETHDDLKSLARSASSLFFIIGSIGLSLIIFFSTIGFDLLGERFEDYKQYSWLFMIGGLMFFLRSISAAPNATLIAVQRFDLITKISIVQITLSSLSMLLAVSISGTLLSVFISQLAVTLFICGAYFSNAKKVLPYVKYNFGWDVDKIKECYKFGLVNFFINIASSALSSLDKMIIPFYAGVSGLTYYSIGGSVGGKIPGVSASLSATLLPTVSQLSAKENSDLIKLIYIRSFRLIAIIAAALTITTISFSYKILFFWLDADFAEKASTILIILALTNFLLALFGPLSNFLFGLGKLKFLSISSIGMGILNAIMIFILLPTYGITGAAYAYLISVLPIIYIFYYVEKKYLHLPARKAYYMRLIISTLITSTIILILNYFLAQLIVSLPTLLIIGGTSFIMYIITYRVFGFFEPKDWADFERFYQILVKKISKP